MVTRSKELCPGAVYCPRLIYHTFGTRSAVLNSELPQNSRIHILEEFNAGLFDYLIETDDRETKKKEDNKQKSTKSKNSRKHAKPKPKADSEFGVVRGIDFKNVHTVLNIDMPLSLEGYVHWIGRDGSAYSTGASVSLMIPRHKKYEGAGEKATTFTRSIWIDRVDAELISVDEEVTLMDWGNAIVKKIEKDQDGNLALTRILHLEGSVKTIKLKLTWLPEIDELVKLSLMKFDYLITKKKLEEGEDFLDVLNPCTVKETAALGDSNMRNMKHGDVLQLERKGYFRCDVPYLRPSKPIVLFGIPDGRQQAGLK